MQHPTREGAKTTYQEDVACRRVEGVAYLGRSHERRRPRKTQGRDNPQGGSRNPQPLRTPLKRLVGTLRKPWKESSG